MSCEPDSMRQSARIIVPGFVPENRHEQSLTSRALRSYRPFRSVRQCPQPTPRKSPVSTPEEPEHPERPTPPSATARPAETPAAGPSDLGGGTSLDKVRDILFGVQMRELERRFALLEERMVKETGDIKLELMQRIEAIEQRTTSLGDQLKTNLGEFGEQQAGLQQRLLDDIRQQMDPVLRTLTRDLQDLRTEKADRVALASILVEIARRLTAEVTTPRAEESRGG